MNNYDYYYYYDCSQLDTREEMEMEEVLRILNAVPSFDDLEEYDEDAY